ncbi:hypothetical protein HT031_003101 [Scenedesmus sp. PABB004]|nr:hypothetical protein HT031_003101 [Scenedesmus sp. PABB004]
MAAALSRTRAAPQGGRAPSRRTAPQPLRSSGGATAAALAQPHTAARGASAAPSYAIVQLGGLRQMLEVGHEYTARLALLQRSGGACAPTGDGGASASAADGGSSGGTRICIHSVLGVHSLDGGFRWGKPYVPDAAVEVELLDTLFEGVAPRTPAGVAAPDATMARYRASRRRQGASLSTSAPPGAPVPGAMRGALVALLLLAVGIACRAGGDEEAMPRLAQLADVDAPLLAAFVANFGGPQRMDARSVASSYSGSYVPSGAGAEYGVPAHVVQGLGYEPWTALQRCGKHYGCPRPAPNPAPYFPTIWEWTSNNPNMTIATEIMKLIGEDVFKGPFTGTLLLPDDTAFAAYLARWKVPIIANNTRAEEFYTNFFIRLLQYHTLLARVYACRLTGGGGNGNWSTVHMNLNGFPHKVAFATNAPGSSCGYGDGCRHGSCDCGGGDDDRYGGRDGDRYGYGRRRLAHWHHHSFYGRHDRGGSCRANCTRPIYYALDEQGDQIALDLVDKFVYGGGVIHTLTGVLQPNDIFPSLEAAIAGDDFSDLRAALNRIQTEGNFSLLPTLEEIPGTLAAPNNDAFAGIDINSVPVSQLLNTVAYHFCAFKRAYRLLYTPYNGKPGKNPCLTILSRAYKLEYGLLWNYQTRGLLERPKMWINYAGGTYPSNLTVENATIVMPDITTPVHTVHDISDLIVPPANLPNQARGASAAAVRAVATATTNMVTRLDLIDAADEEPPPQRRKRDRMHNKSPLALLTGERRGPDGRRLLRLLRRG